MHQLWSGTARNYKDRFWWHLAVMFKDFRIQFACFSFLVCLLFFINFSYFKLDTKNNANFENYASHCLSTWRHSVKKTKFWSKVCMNVKVTMLGSLESIHAHPEILGFWQKFLRFTHQTRQKLQPMKNILHGILPVTMFSINYNKTHKSRNYIFKKA